MDDSDNDAPAASSPGCDDQPWSRVALDLCDDAMVVVGCDPPRVLDLNDAAVRRFGMSRAACLAAAPWVLCGVQSPEAYRRSLAEVVQAHPATVEADAGMQPKRRRALSTPSGWVVIECTPAAPADSADGPEREAHARARAEWLGRALALSQDFIVLIDRQDMRLLEANEVACRFEDMNREAYLACRPWELTAPWLGREDLERSYDRLIAVSPRAVRFNQPLTSRRRGVTTTFEIQQQALRIDGRWVILVLGRDVDDRLAQQARTQRLATALDLSPDFVALVDPASLAFLDANRECLRMEGISRDEMLGKACWLVGPPGTREQTQQLYREIVADAPHPRLSIEERFHAAEGKAIPYEVQRQAIVCGDSAFMLVTGRDIRERLQAEEERRRRMDELARSNKELEQFAYVISHDLSEPLRMITSYTQLLERRYLDRLDGDAREFLAYVTGGAHRMKQLVDDLLLYSRAGRPTTPMRMVDLDRALDGALANLDHAIRRTGATIRRQPLPTLLADKSGMVQVFQNLVGNALKFHADGVAPEVAVQARDGGGEWVISVQDNGIGIEPQYFQRIFVMFQRLHPRDRYEGTGIGLAICKKVIDRLGGRIEVASEPGRGSCFTLHLPRAAASGTIDG